MKTLAILTIVLAGCLGDTTPRTIPGVQPDKSPVSPQDPTGTAVPLPVRGHIVDIRAQITEEMGLPADGTTFSLVSEEGDIRTYQTVTTFAGGGGETCEVSALDAEILSVSCKDLERL